MKVGVVLFPGSNCAADIKTFLKEGVINVLIYGINKTI